MSFSVRMAIRELRASWRRLLLFFLCIALGVGGIVLLRSVVQDVRAGLARDARGLLAADVVISTSRPWDDDTKQLVERRLRSAPIVARTDSVETNTMIRPADDRPVARMAEVRGVGAAFPLYGVVDLEGGARYSSRLLEGRGALVRPELLVQLDMKVGDELLIGTGRFTVRGVIVNEPGRRLGAFSFGPRVLVSAADLDQVGLTGWGSRVSRQIMLKISGDEAARRLTTELRRDLRGRFANARSFQGAEDQVGEDLSRAENYLSLVGLVIVILGGIGVSSVTRVFVQQKVRTIAILKCLGATSRQVFAAYLLQALLLGAAGCVLGVALAWAAVSALPLAFDAAVVAGLPHGLTASAVGQGVAVGLLVAFLFSLVPLLDVRSVKPSLLLRAAHGAGRDRDWLRWAAVGALLAALVLIASWQAASLRVGLVVSVGLAGATLALHLVGLGLVRAVRPLASSRSVALRHAVLRLTRPGNQTRAVLLAVGLGAFFIVGVRSLQVNLLREFSLAIDANGADMFLIDIQPGQADGVRRFLGEHGVPGASLIPVLRARVVGVRGRDVNLDGYESVRGRGGLGREFTVTWRDRLSRNEKVVAGRFWGAGSNPDGEVSIERSLAEHARISLGDVMKFDILGRQVAATVTSVREVDFRDARQGGFIFVFRPGLLDRAPGTFIAPVRGPGGAASRARLQRDLVDLFPNVSIIDLREVLAVVERVLSKVTLGVSVVGGLVLFTGVLILVGSVSMTRFQRIYEAAIFRTLGAGTTLLTLMTAFEYTVLGLLAGLVGSLAAIVLAWYVTSRVLTLRWAPAPEITAWGVVLTTLLVAGVGLAASADILRRRPLGDLRSE
jgi:putative ABC transport system permease protein